MIPNKSSINIFFFYNKEMKKKEGGGRKERCILYIKKKGHVLNYQGYLQSQKKDIFIRDYLNLGDIY